MRRILSTSLMLIILFSPEVRAEKPKVELLRDDAAGRLAVLIDGREALVYQYAPTLDLPHYWPMRSPSGKSMLVEQTEPYPHHRSFWIADTISLDRGPDVSTYNALYSGEKTGENSFGPPFRDRIRHLKFTRLEVMEDRAEVDADLIWETEGGRPVLAEDRQLKIYALGDGEYFLDLSFALTSSFGMVEFVSDNVHYAWPFLRLETRWSGEGGGTITTDTGATGQEATNMKPALWLDYFNTVEGTTEGVAVFQWPDGKEHRWLTREYGCFGPRRPDKQSGRPFALKKGEAITQRVGVFVHEGDVKSGRIAERYKAYVEGNWPR